MQKSIRDKINLKLIQLVKENPVLYDYTDPKYMDFNTREVAWQRIGDELGKPAADCKVRWINIRDVHRRIIRKRLSGSDYPKRAYKYDEHLKFMTNFYKEINPLAGGSAESDNEVDKNETWEVAYNDDSEEVDAKPLKKRIAKSRTKASFEDIELVPASTANESTTDFDTTDPVDSFLISIGATLKKFSPYHLNLAKSKIFQIVQEHDLQQIVEKQQGRDTGVVANDHIYFQGEQSHSFKIIGQ